MDTLDVARLRRPSCADGPDGLIGDDRVGSVSGIRERSPDLPVENRIGLPRHVLRFRFANADDGRQSGAVARRRLGVDHLVRLPVIGSTLGMPHDACGGEAVGKHLRGHIARMSARRSGVAVLCADGEGTLFRKRRCNVEQRAWDAERRVDPAAGHPLEAGGDVPHHGQRVAHAVHLPVSDHDWADVGGHDVVLRCVRRPIAFATCGGNLVRAMDD